jgi:hypothetical protein
MDRAPGYEPEDWEFESPVAYHAFRSRSSSGFESRGAYQTERRVMVTRHVRGHALDYLSGDGYVVCGA